MFGKVRPQIILALMVLGVISVVGLVMDQVPVVTGASGGIIALGMRVLESND
jgi:hypothetical protein